MSQRYLLLCRIRNQLGREFLAELLGTFILLLVGTGNVAQYKFQGGSTYLNVALGWGLGVFAGVLVSGGASGGHVNPAVTLAMAIFGKLPWKKVLVYMAGQYLGGFLGAALTYAIYLNSFDKHDANRTDTSYAGVWGTQPAEEAKWGNAFGDQIVGTAILLIMVCAATDSRNMKVPSGLVALYVGLTVTMVGLSFGYYAGFAINPARDLSPRLLSLIVGYDEVFGSAGWGYMYWWIPVLGPHLGAILGVALYVFCVELHWPETGEMDISKVQDVTGTAWSEFNSKDN